MRVVLADDVTDDTGALLVRLVVVVVEVLHREQRAAMHGLETVSNIGQGNFGSPSSEPKLPCPSTSGLRRENSWAMRTSVSYTEESPCGWYLPITSPTTRALFL